MNNVVVWMPKCINVSKMLSKNIGIAFHRKKTARKEIPRLL